MVNQCACWRREKVSLSSLPHIVEFVRARIRWSSVSLLVFAGGFCSRAVGLRGGITVIPKCLDLFVRGE